MSTLKDVLAPAEEALENISQKDSSQEEQVRLAKRRKAARVEISTRQATNAKSLRSQKTCDERTLGETGIRWIAKLVNR